MTARSLLSLFVVAVVQATATAAEDLCPALPCSIKAAVNVAILHNTKEIWPAETAQDKPLVHSLNHAARKLAVLGDALPPRAVCDARLCLDQNLAALLGMLKRRNGSPSRKRGGRNEPSGQGCGGWPRPHWQLYLTFPELARLLDTP